MIREFVLTRGPSREALFDSLRLGSSAGEHQVLEFYGEHREGDSCGGCLLPVAIEGISRADKEGKEWLFWGRRKQITSGERWVPYHKAQYVDFVFGRWNTANRRGVIKLSDTSFFKSPVSAEEMDAIRRSNS